MEATTTWRSERRRLGELTSSPWLLLMMFLLLPKDKCEAKQGSIKD